MISKGDELASVLKDMIHEKTQKHECKVDLTVEEIYRITRKGALDFGGSEFEMSELKRIEPEKNEPEDDYGWWELEEGRYIIKFNERLTEGRALIQPLTRLLKTGTMMPTFLHESDEELLNILIVGSEGVEIKENARVAGMYKID